MSLKALLVLVDVHGTIFGNVVPTAVGLDAADRLETRINRGSMVQVIVTKPIPVTAVDRDYKYWGYGQSDCTRQLLV